MTDQVNMTTKRGQSCKAVCWLIAIAAGSYLAMTLVNTFAVAQAQAAVYGIVAALLVGLVLRRSVCRTRSTRVQQRRAEASMRARAAAPDGGVASAPDKPIPTSAPIPADSDGDAPGPDPETSDPSDPTPRATQGEALISFSHRTAEPEKPRGRSDQETPSEKPAQKPAQNPAQTPPRIEGVAPEALEAPDNGKPDDFGQFQGIGENEARALNAAGIFHAWQMAAWNRRNIVWVAGNIASDGNEDTVVEWRKQAIRFTREAGRNKD
ncbi:MAG: hypothetical protein ACE5DK_00590 [Paracoccaceae bacterium]